MTITTKPASVLQGFFRRERFSTPTAMTAQAKAPVFWTGKAPRPELMPAKALPSVQAKPAASSAWPGVPRPELLPGMGRSRLAVVQGRTTGDVMTSPVPDGMLRLPSTGKALDNGVRAHMERFFDADFSGVRVHEGPAAQAMGALAFTLGETLYFAPGLYNPSTRAGIELLGHELAHVVQQRDGRVANPYGRGVAIVQDPGLEAEADEMGRRIAKEIWSVYPSNNRLPAARPKRSMQVQGKVTCQRMATAISAGIGVGQQPRSLQRMRNSPLYLWRNPTMGNGEGNLSRYGCEGHIHPDTASNNSDYVITVWTPGVAGHDAKWYIQDTGLNMIKAGEGVGVPTNNECKLLTDLFNELYYQFYLADDDY